MAAPKKRLFKKSSSIQDPKDGSNRETKNESIKDLKEQLSSLQSKVNDFEDGEKSKEIEVKTLYRWESAAHVFIPRGKKWITYVILITTLIIIILVFIKEFFIIAPVLAVAFLAYVLASVPPVSIEHRITNQGVISGKHDYLWGEIYDFWFTEKHKHTILNMDLQAGFPSVVILLVDAKEKEKIKSTLLQYLPFREVHQTGLLENLGDRLSNLFHKIAS